jgi:hypothetical protein
VVKSISRQCLCQGGPRVPGRWNSVISRRVSCVLGLSRVLPGQVVCDVDVETDVRYPAATTEPRPQGSAPLWAASSSSATNSAMAPHCSSIPAFHSHRMHPCRPAFPIGAVVCRPVLRGRLAGRPRRRNARPRKHFGTNSIFSESCPRLHRIFGLGRVRLHKRGGPQ